MFPCALQVIEVNDNTIMWEVMAELIEEESVDAHFIDVVVNKEIVTLTGSVDNLPAKERATEVVETVKGVRAVVSLIEVKPVFRDDEQIKEDVQHALSFRAPLLTAKMCMFQSKTALRPSPVRLIPGGSAGQRPTTPTMVEQKRCATT
jgi:hypothetical protein